MPILDKDDSNNGERAPGVDRWHLVDSELGAESLSIADLSLRPEGTVPNHIHPPRRPW